ncbi:MAG: glycoside hydrolase family 3 C-terminal domain-containing protein [Clostridiales bacterium]|jgi:beta-glucosidase|nr:glycoside hydrolase family 3 C-terminal domain-containing protein [Clostridiales bacterium]
MFKKRLWRALAATLSAVFVVTLSASLLAFTSESDINQRLGTVSYKIINADEDADTEYFKRKTNNLDEYMAQKLDVIERTTDEGIVLVKNDGVLPLKTEKKVSLFGIGSRRLVYNTSSGNAEIGNSGVDSVNMTLKKGMENSGFEVAPSLWNYYSGLSGNQANNTSSSVGQALPNGDAQADIAAYGEAAIVVLTRNTGEGGDAAETYYRVTDNERAVINLAKSGSSKVILVSNSPSPLELDEFERDAAVNAILVVGGVGARGANSIGKILRGTVNPSGRLADIYAADSQSSAAFQNYKTQIFGNAESSQGGGRTSYFFSAPAGSDGITGANAYYVTQKEGIYLGFKYYETRYEDSVMGVGNAGSAKGVYKSQGGGWKYADEVTYGFGYGQSYTAFTQEITSFSVQNSVVNMSVKVKNTGSVAGKEVVQLYAQSPYTAYDKTNKVEKSAVQLVNFGKTRTLAAGAEQTLDLKMDLYNIASYDYTNAKTWVLDDGMYYFAVGNGAHDALNNILAKKGKTAANGMTGNGDAALVKEWNNGTFTKLDTPEFTDEGFTTENGLYHNNTDQKVANVLESADLNNLLGAGTVTYLSRNDWDATWPVRDAQINASAEMIKRLTFDGVYTPGSADTSGIKHDSGSAYQLSMMMGLPYDHDLWDDLLDQMSIEELINSINKNFGAIDPIFSLAFPGTNDNDGVGSGPVGNYLPKFNTAATPFEGVGKYSDVNARMYPSQSMEAQTFNQELMYEIGECLSEDSYYVGFVSLWGPGLNLHRTPHSGRNPEYFSEDAQLTYIVGAQMTAGLQSNGVIACPKHFAFNDAEDQRYGYAPFINEQAARETSLRGFEGAVSVAKAKNVMNALNRIGCDWVGASDPVQNTILRGEWGFDGYVLTDNALQPFQCGRGVAFGTDKWMLLPGNDRNSEFNKAALLGDARLFESVREANHRILYVYVNSAAMNGVSKDATVVYSTPWWKSTLIAADVVFGVIAVGCVAMFVVSNLIKSKGRA